MPKDLGTATVTRKQIRSIQSFQVTIAGATAFIDVAPIIENRDPDTNELIDTTQLEPLRFSEAEMRAILDAEPATITEIGDYNTVYTGLAKLMHALIDARQ